MTHAQLAARAGPGAVTGPPRLWTGNDHDAVPLGLLERLCQVLDLHPAELFQPPARAAQRWRALRPARPPGDETVLEAALATVTTSSGHPGIRSPRPHWLTTALHRLRNAGTPLDAGAARVLYAVAHPRGTLTEGDAADPATVVALQQRGIIRRRPRAGYLELTDDARFSLATRSDPPH